MVKYACETCESVYVSKKSAEECCAEDKKASTRGDPIVIIN